MKNAILIFAIVGLISASCSTVEESGEDSGFVCNTDSISYTKDIVPILVANCYECHSEEEYASEADGNLLEGYEAIKKKIDEGMLIGNINHEKGFIGMPYRRAQLDSCTRLIMMKWVENGAPNN